VIAAVVELYNVSFGLSLPEVATLSVMAALLQVKEAPAEVLVGTYENTEFAQIPVGVRVLDKVGNSFTVIETDPFCVLEQPSLLETLTNSYLNVPAKSVTTSTVTELCPLDDETLLTVPPFMV
jgi:hypothetical protein